MGFWKDISPRRAMMDFLSVWMRENPHRWRVLAVSIALTAGLMILAIPKSERIEPRHPDITYITTFADGRSEAEIIASNIENQKRKDKLAELQRQRDELRRDLYRQLGQATGIDTDAMEAEIAREQAGKDSPAAAAPSADSPPAATQDAQRDPAGE